MAIRIGIIGAGSIAAQHAAVAHRCGASIAGVYDIVPERARRLAAEYEGAVAATQVGELLSTADLQAIVVAAPNVVHREYAVLALRAGKDVLLEKPMAMNVAECDEIISAARHNGRILQLGFVCRGAPAAVAARAVVQSGRLGHIYHAKAVQYRRRGIPGLGRWFTTKSQSGGGALIDLGVHLIDLVLDLTGHPTPLTVSAVCTGVFGSPIDRYRYTAMWAGPPDVRGRFDVEDGACGYVRFDNGMLLEVNVTWAANLPDGVCRNGIFLLGEAGGIYFDPWGREVILAADEVDEPIAADPPAAAGDAWAAAWEAEWRHFIDSVTTRRQPPAGPAAGRAVQVIIDAMYRSASEQREVALP